MFLWFFLPKIDDKSLLIFFSLLKPKGVLKTISEIIQSENGPPLSPYNPITRDRVGTP
ncbi:hypothetical protein HPSA50_0705 [Helicobacter pylori SouthAfrica50]|uniref:Uncharacterized protein n=1 Tax=Helicobacter pylori SouthAfrica50 TaxID=1352357 RepID=T2S7X0_HELPX|nr:hypothetical protein HPSA50_0705 [Helicobacter pylori SouthAfrica50]